MDKEKRIWRREKKSGEIRQRGLKLAVIGAPPCNMGNDSNGVGGLESLWNFNGE